MKLRPIIAACWIPFAIALAADGCAHEENDVDGAKNAPGDAAVDARTSPKDARVEAPDAPDDAALDARKDSGRDAGKKDAATTDAGDASAPPTSVFVVRVGAGAAALTVGSTAVFLDELKTSDGSLLRTIPLPVAASGQNQPFSMTGTAVSEGALSTSSDGQYLVLAGYAAAPGAVAALSTSTSAAVSRVVARVDSTARSTHPPPSAHFSARTTSARRTRPTEPTSG